MAEALALALLTAAALPTTGITLAVTTALIGLGISVGVSFLAQAFLTPPASSTKPSDRQFTVSGPTPVRFRSYGRVRIGGAQMFVAASDGRLYRVTAHNDGLIDAIEEHLLDGEVVAIDGSGDATSDRWVRLGTPLIHIETRLGEADQSHYATVEAAIPAWDSTHKGNGIAHSLVTMRQVPAEKLLDWYPNRERTAYTQTIRASLVWDPRDEDQDPDDSATWTWAGNEALVVLDYLRHATGFGMPLEWIMPEIDGWKAAADACDEEIPLRAGGTEPRYRLWGTYSYDERPGDVLNRFLVAGGAKLWVGPNGGVLMSPGVWVEPTIVIDDDAILGMSLSSGNERPTAANTITAKYVEPALGYRETDAVPWKIDDLVASYGEIRASSNLFEVPSHAQARRIMKQAAAKLAPAWRGTLHCNLRALPALSERFVRLTSADFDLDITIEIDGVEFDVGEGGIVRGLVIEFTSIEQAAYDWDAETEEGEPADVPPRISPDGLSPPENFGVAMRATGSTDVEATWDALPDPTLIVRVKVERTDVPGVVVSTNDSAAGATSLVIIGLTDGVSYRFVALARTSARQSDETDPVTLVCAIDPVAPGAPTSLSATPSGSNVTVAWTNPASANTAAARVYRNTSDNSATATLIATVTGGPSAGLNHADNGLAVGAYWWWVAAINGSNVEGTRTAAGTATIT